jgi:uncharacterized membrane protein YraQ (UPF0718 family)
VKPWVSYSLIRAALFIGVFAIVFAIAAAQGIDSFIAAIIAGVIAAIVGATVSYIFFSKQRQAVATALYEARHPSIEVTGADEDAEDAAAASGASEGDSGR